MSRRVIALSSYAGTKALNQTIFKELGTCKKTWSSLRSRFRIIKANSEFRGDTRQQPNWGLLRKLDLK